MDENKKVVKLINMARIHSFDTKTIKRINDNIEIVKKWIN